MYQLKTTLQYAGLKFKLQIPYISILNDEFLVSKQLIGKSVTCEVT